MRIFWSLFFAIITIGLIIVLNIQLPANGGKTPRLGLFLSPEKGFWQNAEPSDVSFNKELHFKVLKGNTEVYLDERLVPHIYAENENDAFFAEGYLHAKFRLWQMEFQTYAAAGRLSEIMGAKSNGKDFLAIDKYFRRLGMVYAAENSLRAAEADTLTKNALDSYTAGVNEYISSLHDTQYPLEYKLLDYKPEKWSNLKSMLFLKYMSFDLSGSDNDFEMTNAKTIFTKKQFEKLFPYEGDSVENIIPKSTVFSKPGIKLKVPADADSLYFNYKDSVDVPEKPVVPDKNNGSNNWAVSGNKTQSGRPILCNDPHLGLNLPSLWYEIQISTPGYNVYGVSFPGAPGVIIGFNDHCAFGVTNAQRDVKDYYEIKFKDSSMQQYWFKGTLLQTAFRNEIIKIKNGTSDTEHIAMTVWGPVLYDKTYPDKLHTGKAYAVRWTAHDGGNELKTFLMLDRAENYDDYMKAISSFSCPGQNFVFACKNGDIAIKEEGAFPAKWRRQGDFLMPGYDSTYAWKIIPDSENIVLHNPARGFVSSANQYAYDTSYNYYLGGNDYEYFRGKTIDRYLSSMQHITLEDMQKMQTNNYNLLAEMAKPYLLKYIQEKDLNTDGRRYLTIFKIWNLRNDANEQGPSVFTPWWDSLKYCMYHDEFSQSKLPMPQVNDYILLESLKDSAYEFADDITTPQKETMSDVVTTAFKKIIPLLEEAENNKAFEWSAFKNSGVMHLLRIPAFSREHLYSGGGIHVINAYKQYHGPSWRMVVQLTDETQAYGVYPGGQSGNPGSRYYDNFVDDWLKGKSYHIAIVSQENISKRENLKGKITFSKP